ncbi:hypothetical protein B296_00022419, partial [Ensete ventricosum]
LRYGYYGTNRLALGPNSSRMMTTSSLFVEQLQVKDEAGLGLLLYGFNDRPQLSSETNWTISSDLFVDTYSRQENRTWRSWRDTPIMTWPTQGMMVPVKVWHIQLSFVARLTSYFLVTDEARAGPYGGAGAGGGGGDRTDSGEERDGLRLRGHGRGGGVERVLHRGGPVRREDMRHLLRREAQLLLHPLRPQRRLLLLCAEVKASAFGLSPCEKRSYKCVVGFWLQGDGGAKQGLSHL